MEDLAVRLASTKALTDKRDPLFVKTLSAFEVADTLAVDAPRGIALRGGGGDGGNDLFRRLRPWAADGGGANHQGT